MRFSERINKRAPKIGIQLDSMDAPLRNSLWNIINLFINTPLKGNTTSLNVKLTGFSNFFSALWFRFYKEPLDEMPDNVYTLIQLFKEKFFDADYLDVYDLFDFIITQQDLPFRKDQFIAVTNNVLKTELSAYRVINGLLAPITTEVEIEEVENALNNASINKYKGAHIHLKEALNKISDKKDPDYRNSIKESISAIESLCQVIGNDPKAELPKTLKVLKAKIPIHGALEQAFIKLYGYTSDGDGIRHALLEETDLDQEDAIFMLVSCSAFVNYLIVKANK